MTSQRQIDASLRPSMDPPRPPASVRFWEWDCLAKFLVRFAAPQIPTFIFDFCLLPFAFSSAFCLVFLRRSCTLSYD
jgi:hypothetical protein